MLNKTKLLKKDIITNSKWFAKNIEYSYVDKITVQKIVVRDQLQKVYNFQSTENI